MVLMYGRWLCWRWGLLLPVRLCHIPLVNRHHPRRCLRFKMIHSSVHWRLTISVVGKYAVQDGVHTSKTGVDRWLNCLVLSGSPSSCLFSSTFLTLPRTCKVSAARSKTLHIYSLHHPPPGCLGGKKMCQNPSVQELLMECHSIHFL